jgi:hypothetical protein
MIGRLFFACCLISSLAVCPHAWGEGAAAPPTVSKLLTDYRALKDGIRTEWPAVQQLSSSTTTPGAQVEQHHNLVLLGLMIRANKLHQEAMNALVDKLKAGTVNGKPDPERSQLEAMAAAAGAIGEEMSTCMSYLGTGQDLYLKAAGKYEEVWHLFDVEVERTNP